MSKHILLVRRAKRSHKAAYALGYKLSVIMEVSQIKEADLTCYERIIGISDNADINEWIKAAENINSLCKVDVLGVFSEPAEYIGHEIAQKLKLPFHNLDTIELTHNKFAMREKLRNAGVDLTPSKIINPPFFDEVKNFAESEGYPIIIKPIAAHSSKGVSKIDSLNDIQSAINWLQEAGPFPNFVAEKFLIGDEYSVEAFSERGEHYCLAITKKFKDEIHFVEEGHMMPASLTNEVKDKIFTYVKNVLSELGVENGVTHTELMLTQDGPNIIETHLRPGGDHIDKLIKLTLGIDLVELWIKQVAGESVAHLLKELIPSCGAAVKYHTPQTKGKLKEIKGVDIARLTAGVIDVEVLTEIGSEVVDVTSSSSRSLCVLTKANSAQEALQIANSAIEKLEFVIE